MSAVEARDLFRVHRTAEGDAAALQGLDLAVGEGEVVAVLGPSGSGKSTLLRLLAGLEPPSAGSLRVLGVDPGTLPARAAAAFRASALGVVDQHYHRALSPDLRAGELVALPLALRGAAAGERRRRAAELLERLGLGDRAGARPHELSGGEQQRVAVAAALAHRPRLLLADEPGGELDAASAEAVYGAIASLARDQGATVVLVSHDPQAGAIADRTLQLRDGRIATEARRGEAPAAVVGRTGWVHLPEALRRDAGVGARVHLADEDGALVLRPATAAPAAPTAAPAAARPAQGPTVAELRGVTKGYGRGGAARTPLRGLDARFAAGQLCAVTGRSGSGKSTLLHLLAGLERPSEGEVVVAGEALAGLDRAGLAAFRRRHVALVTQEPGLVPFLGAAENVRLGLELRGVDEAEADARAERWLTRLGLGERLRQRVDRLSAGERQRVALARALAAEPALLLADEPTSRLDQASAREVAATLRAAAAEGGVAVVVATHEPLLVEAADELLPLDRHGNLPAA